LVVPVAIGLLAAGRWAWSEVDAPERGRGARGPVPVEVVAATRGPLEEVRELTGTLEPSADVTLNAEIEGVVEAVHADLGDSVDPGQSLASLDDRVYRQEAAAAAAALRVAQARARAAERTLEVAERALERTEALAQRGVASERALDEARARRFDAASQVEVTHAEVARARAATSAARLQVERTEIRGRWSADQGARRVAARLVDEGARVSVGDALFRLVDTDPLVVVVMASARDYARLGTGQAVALRSAEGERVDGRVARVAPAFDPDSRQARIEIEVDNPEGALQPGAFVRARAELRRVEDAVIVPSTAVVTRGGRSVVFVVADGVATMVPVEVELRSAERSAVRAERELGDVVTLGQQRLTDGAEVRVVADVGDAGVAR